MTEKYILKKSIKFTPANIPISKLRFWHENPRVYAEIFSMYGGHSPMEEGDQILQEKIFRTLQKLDNVRKLRNEIETSGGLVEALIVRKRSDADIYEVLEGNRRLAACKMILDRQQSSLAKAANQSFSILPCEVAPDDLGEEYVFALLGVLHLKGKADWSPFAKASYIKRRFERLGNNYQKIAREIQESEKEIRTQIDNIDLMQEFGETSKDMYSFYNVLHRNKYTKEEIKESDFKKKKLVEEAQAWREDDRQATDFRNALNDMFKDKQVVKKYFNENKNLSLEEGRDEAVAKGSTDVIYNRIKKFRTSLNRDKRRLDNLDPTEAHYKKLKYEIDKLNSLIGGIHGKFQKRG